MTLRSLDPRVFCPRGSDLAIHSWSDGVVVYDDANGSLHALSPVAGEALIQLLELESASATSLARTLMHDIPVDEDVSLVANLITEFESMGFVERLPE